MSAKKNNSKNSNNNSKNNPKFSYLTKLIKLFFVLLAILVIALIISDMMKPRSGQEEKTMPVFMLNLTENYSEGSKEESEEGEAQIIVIGGNQSSVIVLENNTNVTLSNLSLINISTNQSLTPATPNVSEASEQAPLKASEVEFYFLLKGKAYFKHTLREEQNRTYNLSGYLVNIEPIIITRDSVKFRINNYTLKALAKDEWGSDDDFEIFVSDIYYRS